MKNVEKLCIFLHSFKRITWTKLTLTICLFPFVQLFLILILIILLTTDSFGAVVSNSEACALIGRDILAEDGSAVDAAIAVLICEGVVVPYSSGIGGGFAAVFFMEGETNSVVATPSIPAAIRDVKNLDATYLSGPKAVGVPGELLGYWMLHQKYGLLPWKRLFEPSIELCIKGMHASQRLSRLFYAMYSDVSLLQTMKQMFPFINSINYRESPVIKHPVLAETLTRIANEGVSAFYNGTIGELLIQDIQRHGGVMTLDDLSKFRARYYTSPPHVHMKGFFKIVTTPLPTSGAVLTLVLNVIKNLRYEDNLPLFWHRVIEATKHAFGQNLNLGDIDYDPQFADLIEKAYEKMTSVEFARYIRRLIEDNKSFNATGFYKFYEPDHTDEASSNVCVLSPRGDLIAVTTSLLKNFGSYFYSNSTGIILNNIFSHYVQSGHQQLTKWARKPLHGKHLRFPFTPAIVVQERTARPYYAISASGENKASTTTINAIIKFLMFMQTANEAIKIEQIHTHLVPNMVEYEDFFDPEVLTFLKTVGHEIVRTASTFSNFTSVSSIGRRYMMPEVADNQYINTSRCIIASRHNLNMVILVIIAALCVTVIGILLFEVFSPLISETSSSSNSEKSV